MRKLFCLFAFVSLSLASYAQMNLGIKVGGNTNYATVTGFADDYKPNFDNYTGMTAGIELGINLDENFTFKPNLTYTQKGFIMRESTDLNLGFDLPLNAKGDIRTNHIDLQALLQYNIINKSSIQAYSFFGPYYAFTTDGFAQAKLGAIFDFNVKRIDFDFATNQYNRHDLGLVAGGGIGTTVGKGQIFADIKYLHGFKDQMKDNLIDVGYKNRSINYSFGYRFNL